MTMPIQLSGADLASSVGLKFNVGITSFEFKPSIGIVAKDLDRLAFSLESFKVPLERSVERVIIPSIRRNFESGGRPPWEPLAEFTVTMRGSAGPILVRTGALERAATSKDIWSITRQSATVKSLPADVWYGVVHQGGYQGGGSSFASHLATARGILGHGAGGMELIRMAFAVMDRATGGPQGEGGSGINIPARPFIVYQEEDVDHIRDIFSDWVGEMIVANWDRFGGVVL